jgi:uncharacterized protein
MQLVASLRACSLFSCRNYSRIRMGAHSGTGREAAYGRRGPAEMNIRQLLLDVDKAIVRPSLLEIAAAIDACRGVEAVNITVEEIDIETVGMNVTIEGDNMDYEQIASAIESTSAVVHSRDQIAVGDRITPRIARVR